MTCRIDTNWSINVHRGRCKISAGRKGFSVSNGQWESGFSPEKKLYSVSLDPSKRSISNKEDNRKSLESDLEENIKLNDKSKNTDQAYKEEDKDNSSGFAENVDSITTVRLDEKTEKINNISINGRIK